jgi:hypothetical protein
LLTPSAELLSGALDRNTAGADGQSYAAAKPIRIRLRLKPPPKRLSRELGKGEIKLHEVGKAICRPSFESVFCLSVNLPLALMQGAKQGAAFTIKLLHSERP